MQWARIWGSRSAILCLKLLQHRYLSGTQRRVSNRPVSIQIVAPANFSLERPFHIAEGEGRVSVAGPCQQVLDESDMIGVRAEPFFPEAPLVVVGFMRCST